MSITIGDAIVYLVSDDSQLKEGLARAEGLTGGFSSNMAGAFQVAMGNLMAQAVTGLVTAVGDGVQAMAGFFAGGIEGAISLDAQLASIAAKMGATKDEVLPLKDLIFSLSLDPNLVVNTTQAAEAIEMLAGNGATMTDIVNGLAASTVALANATGNDFGLAAEVATSAMDLFGLKAADTQKAFDGFVGVTVATKFGINDMKLALAQSGAVFAGMGGQIEDFNAVIAGTATSFASGSDAGTSFKTVLQRLANPTDEMKSLMSQYGISLFDSSGKMRDMGEVVGQLNQALYGQVTVTQMVGGATKEQTKAAGEAATKIPDLTHKISEQKEQLQFLSNQLFETRKWYAEGSDEVLKAKDKYDDMAKTIADNEAKLNGYNQALGAVADSHATTTTSTKTLTEAERANFAAIIGGADGARMLVAMGKMTQEQYNALADDVNKAGLAFATAATQVDSVQGAFDIFLGVIEAVQIQLGDALLPLIRQMTEVFTVFASVAAPMVVGGFKGIADSVTAFMQMVLPSVGELNQAFKDNGIDGMLKLVGDNILGLLIPMGDARDGFAEMNATLNDSRAMIASLIGLDMTNWLTGIANAFKSGGLDGVMNLLTQQITTGIPNLISNIGQSIINGAGYILESATTMLQAIPQALADFAPDADSAQQLGSSLARSILSAFGLAVSTGEAVSTPLSAFFSALGTAAMSMSGVLFEVATNVASGFLAALQERFTTIDVSGIFGGLMGVLGGGAIASAFASLAASITPMLPILTSIGAGFSSFMAILAPLTTLIGASLAPAIAFIVAEAAAMGATFSIMFGSFASGLPFVSSISAGFAWLITTITPLATFLAPITAALGSVGIGFAALINPITLAGVAIIGLGAMWGTNFEQMNSLAMQVFDYLLPTWDKLKEGFNGFIAALAPAMPSITQLFDTFIAAIPSMQIMAGVVIGGLVVAVGKLGDVLAAILPSLGMVIAGLVTGLSGALSGAIQFIDGAVQMIYNLLTGDLGKAREGALDVLTGLVSGVEAIFTGLAQIAVGLITGLAEGIYAAMPDLGAALADLANYIVETAMELLGVASPSTIFAEIGAYLIEGLAEGISDASAALDAISEMVTTLIDTALEVVESGADSLAEAWVSAWDVVAESTSGAIDGIIEYVSGLADGAIELIGSAMDTISELWDSGWSTIADLADSTISTITDLIDTFASGSEGVMDTFMTTVSELWDVGWTAIYELADSAISSIYDTLDSFSSDAGDTWDSLTTNLSDIWDSVWAMMTEALASAIESISGLIDGVASYAESTWDNLGSALSAVWAGAWSAIEGVMSNASGVLSGLMGGVQSTLSAIWQVLSDYLNTAWTVAWGLIQSAGEAAWSVIGSGIDTLSTTIQTVWEMVSSAISTAWDTAWSLIQSTYDRVSGSIKGSVTDLSDAVSTAMNAASDVIKNVWNSVWETAAKATTAGKNNIVGLIGDFLTGAKNRFNDFAADWVDAGKDILDGVIEGLELQEDALVRMMLRLAYRALTEAKKALGIASPSQVFSDEVGYEIVAGMTEGVDGSSSMLFDSVGSLATGAVNAAVSGISGARDAIGGIFGGAFGEYISTNISATVGQAIETATVNLQGIESTLKQSLSLMNNNSLSQETRMEAFTREFAKSMSDLDTQYQTMLKSGMNPDEALAQYTASANRLKDIAQAAAMTNNTIRKGVESFQQTGQKNSKSSFYGSIATDIQNAIDNAKLMGDQQKGIGEIFSFGLGDIKTQMSQNVTDIINLAGVEAARLNEKFVNRSKEDHDDPVKILKDLSNAVSKGITDSSKEMVDSTKKLLASGLNPKEAMGKYIEMTRDAYALLNQDTIVKELPETVREGKQVLQEAYQDILNTVDSQFIGATKSKLSEAGKLFKQGLSDGLDISTVMSVFNESMTSISESMKDEFISGMPMTLQNANGLMNEQYRKMKDDLEKGLVSGTKDGMKKAGEALTQGIKEGLDPAQLIANYRQTASLMQQGFTDELVALVPQGVSDATKAIDDATDKLLGSLKKDFVGGVKGGLGEAESALKKGFTNMTDPAQAQGFIDAYLESMNGIKETFKGGVASMIPDAQGLTTTSSEKMASEISKSFIKASKDKFKDMQAEITKGLVAGTNPQELIRNFNALSEGIHDQRIYAMNSVKFDLGQVVPKELMALPETFEAESIKATEAIEKFLTGGIKTKMAEASAAMKEGVKKGLNLEELVAAYQQVGATLKGETANTQFSGVTSAAIEAQLKSTKDYIEGEFSKEVKGSIKNITTDLKNGLTLGADPAKALADYQRELAKVNGFIGGELGKSMPEAMKAARESVNANYEDVFGAIAKQAKGSLSDAKNAFKEALAGGIDPSKAMADYQAVAGGITSVISNELGKNAPLAIKVARDELEDSLKAVKELLKKSLVTDVKDQMSDASKAFKEGLKEGLDPAGLLTAYQSATDAASTTAKGLGDFPLVMDETNAKIKATTDDMLALLKNNLVAGVKESMGSLKTDLKENMDFGGTVAEAITQLNTQTQALKDEFANGLGGQVPGAIEAANALIEQQKTALLKNLGGKFVGELKDAIKAETAAYKEALEQGIDPTQALGAFNASISTVMAGMTSQLTEATPNLARMANGLVTAAQAELAKLGGGDVGSQAVTAIGDGITSTVATLSDGLDGAVQSIAANVAPVVTTIAGAMSEALPEVTTQGDLLIAEVNRIGAALITAITGESGILPTIKGSLIGETEAINPVAFAYGKSIKDNFTVGLWPDGIMAIFTGEQGLFLAINGAITTDTVNIAGSATAYGQAIGTGIAEGIAANSQVIYDNLSAITTRVNTDVTAINNGLAQAQAGQSALAAIGQAAQQMVNNVNNAVATTNNNNITINNPVPQPAAMDLMMMSTLF